MVQNSNEFILVAIILCLVLLGSGILFFMKCDWYGIYQIN